MTNSQFLILFFTTSMFLSCNYKYKAFYVERPTMYRNDFIEMAESKKGKLLNADEILTYLTNKEQGDSRFVYKQFKTIKDNEKFKAIVFLKIGNQGVNDYTFFVRTFSKSSSQIISTYEFGKWITQTREYCFGSVYDDLSIEKECGGKTEKVKFNELGLLEI